MEPKGAFSKPFCGCGRARSTGGPREHREILRLRVANENREARFSQEMSRRSAQNDEGLTLRKIWAARANPGQSVLCAICPTVCPAVPSSQRTTIVSAATRTPLQGAANPVYS